MTFRWSRVRTPGEARWDSASSHPRRVSRPAWAVSSIWGRMPASTRSSRRASPTSSVSSPQITVNTAPTPIPAATARGSRHRPERNRTPGSAARASSAPMTKGAAMGSRYLTPRKTPAAPAARYISFFIKRGTSFPEFSAHFGQYGKLTGNF